MNDNPITPLTASRRKDTQTREARITKAIAEMLAAGEEINISSVARSANVSRTFFTRHPESKAEVLKAAEELLTPLPVTGRVSAASLKAENMNLAAMNKRLRQQVLDMENTFSEMLGQEAFDRTGLGGPRNHDQLEARIAELVGTILDLRSTIEERETELEAARAANRRLMSEMNR